MRKIEIGEQEFELNARRDTADFRDKLYTPTLVEVQPQISLQTYLSHKIPVLNQGSSSACTGYALATVAYYLLTRRKGVIPKPGEAEEQVSPWMFYELAKRYDEWEGEEYEGSSARGAIKAWHKHGVCASDLWKYSESNLLTIERIQDALKRPLGAYFRVNHKDIVALHSAITEVGVLYATAVIHDGWQEPNNKGIIKLKSRTQKLGGHAFVIVGYDDSGFWIQNSWGTDWGNDGFAHISYEDWLEHGYDTWVTRLGAPVNINKDLNTFIAAPTATEGSGIYAYSMLRPHIISTGNDGKLRAAGSYGTSKADVVDLFENKMPGIMHGWKKKRLLLYAHGGLVPQQTAQQRVADYRRVFIQHEIYPLAFIWKTDYWSTIKNMLQDALLRRRSEGIFDSALDFMLDRLDDALEPIARLLTGKASWDEMKENARLSSASAQGGAAIVTREIIKAIKDKKIDEVHVAAHSAGSIFMAPIIKRLVDEDIPISSCTLWAPACTMKVFEEHFMPGLEDNKIDRMALFTLTDQAEQDDHCAHIYHKSLLYLVSNAFEAYPRIPLFRDGEPLLGMAKFIEDEIEKEDSQIGQLIESRRIDWVKSPNSYSEGHSKASRALRHGDFDDDAHTLQATLARILAKSRAKSEFNISRSKSGLKNRRTALLHNEQQGVTVVNT